jgi:hypothetical protein
MVWYHYHYMPGEGYMSFRFEWNEDKSKQNLAKHGVSFDEASTIFGDPLSLTIYDDAHSTDEDRYIDIGRSTGQLHLNHYGACHSEAQPICTHAMKRHSLHRFGCFHGCLAQTSIPQRCCSAR